MEATTATAASSSSSTTARARATAFTTTTPRLPVLSASRSLRPPRRSLAAAATLPCPPAPPPPASTPTRASSTLASEAPPPLRPCKHRLPSPLCTPSPAFPFVFDPSPLSLLSPGHPRQHHRHRPSSSIHRTLYSPVKNPSPPHPTFRTLIPSKPLLSQKQNTQHTHKTPISPHHHFEFLSSKSCFPSSPSARAHALSLLAHRKRFACPPTPLSVVFLLHALPAPASFRVLLPSRESERARRSLSIPSCDETWLFSQRVAYRPPLPPLSRSRPPARPSVSDLLDGEIPPRGSTCIEREEVKEEERERLGRSLFTLPARPPPPPPTVGDSPSCSAEPCRRRCCCSSHRRAARPSRRRPSAP